MIAPANPGMTPRSPVRCGPPRHLGCRSHDTSDVVRTGSIKTYRSWSSIFGNVFNHLGELIAHSTLAISAMAAGARCVLLCTNCKRSRGSQLERSPNGHT